jgi:hypothetical protein
MCDPFSLSHVRALAWEDTIGNAGEGKRRSRGGQGTQSEIRVFRKRSFQGNAVCTRWTLSTTARRRKRETRTAVARMEKAGVKDETARFNSSTGRRGGQTCMILFIGYKAED